MGRKMSITMIAALLANLLSAIPAAAEQQSDAGAWPDVQAHWAAAPIERWIQAGLVSGFEDGSFHPGESVTRAQLAVMLNGLFGVSKGDPSSFADVSADAWYAEALQKAKSAGYMNGYEDGTIHPNEQVSRQDAAVMLVRLFQLSDAESAGSAGSSVSFADAASVSDYAQSAVRLMAAKGYLNGYEDGTFQPLKPLTRAEMSALLDKMVGQYVTEQGSFPSASGQGSAILNAPNAKLSSQVVGGNLFITERVGEGDAVLDSVQVKGTTFVAGGGAHSIHVDDSTLGKTVVNKKDGSVRLVVSGSGSIGETLIQSSAILEENGITYGAGFTSVKIDEGSRKSDVTLAGAFSQVSLKNGRSLLLSRGNIDELTVDSQAEVTVEQDGTVKQLTVGEAGGDSKLTVRGNVEQLTNNAPTLNLNDKPVVKGASLTVKAGVPQTMQAPMGGGGYGGGGSGGSGGGVTPGGTDTSVVDLIGDGDFTNSLGAWSAFWGDDSTGQSTGTMEQAQGELKVSLQSVGNYPTSAQIVRSGLVFQSGTEYTVSFDARASVGRKFNVAVTDGTADVATLRNFVLSTSKKHYEYTFTMSAESTDSGRLSFQLGSIPGSASAPVDVFFDNVKITALKASIVDKTALNAKIAETYRLEESDYTPTSWSMLQNALVTAKEASFSNTASKASVDSALGGLTRAIQGLEPASRASGLTAVVLSTNTGVDLQTVINPAFQADRFNYLIGLTSDVASVTLTPAAAAGSQVASVTGADADSGSYVKAVQTGINEVAVRVAEAGKEDAVYHFYFVKEQSGSVRRDPSDWEMTWNDEFNGDQVDTSKWNFVDQGGGFGNKELEYYTPRSENARIEPISDTNKALVIEARKEKYKGSDYTSAKLFSQNKGDWTYGKFDIRAKLPKSQGIWPAIWMMPTNYDLYGPWPQTGEIDIMEMIGSKPKEAVGTLHYGLPWKYTNSTFTLPGDMDFSQDFHTFSIEWEPGEIRWYVDGIFYQKQNDWYTKPNGENTPYTWPAPFDRDFYMQLNLAVGGEWPQYPDKTTILPSRMLVDYVHVYKLKDGLTYRQPGDGPYADAAEPTPHQDQGAGGFILNGTFDRGQNRMAYWTFAKDNSAQASGSVGTAIADREFKASVVQGGADASSVQLTQSHLPLVKDKQYKLKFKARASEAGQALDVNVVKAGSPAVNYSNKSPIALSAEMKEYSYIFTMNANTDNNARLQFNFGGNTGDIFLDDVQLIEYVPPAYMQKQAASEHENMQGFAIQDGAVVPDGSASSFIQYNFDIPADGDYVVSYQVAAAGSQAKLTFKGTEPDTRTIHLPYAGGADQWQTVTDLVHLRAGKQILLLSGASYRLKTITITPNIVKNGAMDTGTSLWELYSQYNAATVSTEQGQTKLAIAAQGDDFWGTQFSEKGFTLVKNKNYRVTFDAKSTVNRKMRLTMDDPDDFTAYALYDSVVLTPKWKTYTFEFTMTGATNTKARIDFNLGKIGDALGAHEVYLDNVRLEEIPEIAQSQAVQDSLQIDVPGEIIQVQQADGFTALGVDQGALYPAFSSSVSDYTVKLPTGTAGIQISPTLVPGSTIKSVTGAVEGVVSGATVYTASLVDGDNPISFILEQPGRVPRGYTIHVIRTPQNLALGKVATASSNNGGFPASLAVDGRSDTRWESAMQDPQSIMVDLADRYNLSSVQIDWETARAKAYTLEVSEDQVHWITIYKTTDGSGATDTIAIPQQVTARYIRMNGTARTTAYGYSIYEIKASGTPYATEADFHAFKGALAARIADANSLEAADYTADSWTAFAAALAQASGTLNQSAAAQSEVDAAVGSLIQALASLVKLTKAEGFTQLTLSQGSLSPQFNQDVLNYSIIVDNAQTSIDFTTVLAQDNVVSGAYGLTSVTDAVYHADLSVGHNELKFVISKPGAQIDKVYKIDAVRLPLAAHLESATASTGNADFAIDGNPGTRWESSFSDPQWIYVDLGSSKSLEAVQIVWEGASAKTYKIQVTDTPNDENSWTDAISYDYTGQSTARTDLLLVSGTGRYVRMYGMTRTMPYGYSIFEWQVFTK